VLDGGEVEIFSIEKLLPGGFIEVCPWRREITGPVANGAVSEVDDRRESAVGVASESVLDDVETLSAQSSEVVEHRFEHFGRMGFPIEHFVGDAHRVAGSIRPGDVAGELLVGHVGVVFERT
jgi:hypothetical protein